MKKLPFLKGLTLIELMVGMFVFALVSTAAFLIFTYSMKVSIYNSTRIQMQHNARLAMERIVTEAKNATSLPWQSSGFNPQVAPAPVFYPFLTVTREMNKFCFSEPIPEDAGGNLASNFQLNDTSRYRLVLYYIENPSGNAGAPLFEPTGKTQSDIDNNKKTSLKRFMANLVNPLLPTNAFDPNWPIRSVDPNSTGAGYSSDKIIEMPFATDYIHFTVSHDLDPAYYDQKKAEFAPGGVAIYDRGQICDPLLYRLDMTVVQYTNGQLVPSNKQEFKLDAVLQVRSAY